MGIRLAASWMVALWASAALAAGCIDDRGAAAAAGARGTLAPSADPAEFTDETGALHGFVVDEEVAPIAGADVLIRPGERQSTTAADGSFSFSRLEPGSYSVFVSKLGYHPASRSVTVEAGKATPLTPVLQRIAVTVSRSEILPTYTGYMQCRLATLTQSGPCGWVPYLPSPYSNAIPNALFTKDKNRNDFNLTGEDWRTIVFEAQWNPTSIATRPDLLIVFSHRDRVASHSFNISDPDDRYIKMVYRRPATNLNWPNMPDPHHVLTAFMIVPFGSVTNPVNAAYEQAYESVISVFYSSEPPDGFSAFK